MSTETHREGMAYAVASYVMWGFFPLYWAMLRHVPATEVLAHRILGTFVLMSIVLVVSRRLPALWALTGRQWALLAVASVLVTTNWLVYIWGVQNDHVVEASLGYFINPLVTVALGVVVLGERMRKAQMAALALAGLAVLGLAVEIGRVPWIALVLAFSFALYSLVKKKAGAPPRVSVLVETAFFAGPAAAWLWHLGRTGADSFLAGSPGTDLLLLASGAVTAAPLLAFAAAANRVPFTALGVLQYLSPSLQFLCGVLILGEHMSAARWAGFGLVWAALIVYTAEGFWRGRTAVVPRPA